MSLDESDRQRQRFAFLSCAADACACEAEAVDENKKREIALVQAAQLQEKAMALGRRESRVASQLESMDILFSGRRQPIMLALNDLQARRAEMQDEIRSIMAKPPVPPPPPGPAALRWVDSDMFSVWCNVVVMLNLAAMGLGPSFADLSDVFHIADHAFLMWYVIELTLRYMLHGRDLFVGSCCTVWWNWLDLLIVVSGVVDQWFMLVINAAMGGGSMDTSKFKVLRFLRLFRVLRVLKILRVLVEGDLKWTQSSKFQLFMSAIIGANALVMSMELDFAWSGWVWVERVFLLIYMFELFVHMKFAGCHFWVDLDNIVWNYLDFTIVTSGFLDMFLMPLFMLFTTEVLGHEGKGSGRGSLGNLMSLLRMLRIFRILRLVRLMKVIKPLYLLMFCIIEAMGAMQYVLVLTGLVLYAMSIIYTTTIGHGMVYGERSLVPEEVVEAFGTTSSSLFSLFCLMNGDTDVIDLIASTMIGKVLIICFVVLANWSVLAILTSVVSDNMISSAKSVAVEDERKEKNERLEQNRQALHNLFLDIDSNGTGKVTRSEWDVMLENEELVEQLLDVTALDKEDLEQFFNSLSEHKTDCQHHPLEPVLDYDVFVHHLQHSQEPADGQSVLMLMSRIEMLGDRINELCVEARPSLESHMP